MCRLGIVKMNRCHALIYGLHGKDLWECKFALAARPVSAS